MKIWIDKYGKKIGDFQVVHIGNGFKTVIDTTRSHTEAFFPITYTSASAAYQDALHYHTERTS